MGGSGAAPVADSFRGISGFLAPPLNFPQRFQEATWIGTLIVACSRIILFGDN